MRLFAFSLCRYSTFVIAVLSVVVAPAWSDDTAGSQNANQLVERSAAEDEQYYELLKVFADTLDQVERNYVDKISRRELMEAAIKGVLSKLDPHSSYISPDQLGQFKKEIEKEFGGIGIHVGIDRGRLTILSPIVGSPAYKVGVEAGDRIVRIEGEDTADITIDEAVTKLKGEIGSEVTITIRRASEEEPRDVTIRRDIVRVETVMGYRRAEDDSWDFMLDHEKKIGFVRLTSFSPHSAAEMRAALKRLEKEDCRGLIFDLRFNPGGLLSAAIEVSDMFLSAGRIVSTEGRNTAKRVWDARQAGTYEDIPLVVLINNYSASASEIVAACLQDHARAVIVGQRSWGKGSVQNIIELDGGRSALKLTTAGYLRPSGKNIHRPRTRDGSPQHGDSGDSENADDEWGVRPNEGFRIKLSNDEVIDLLSDQRQRNIVRKEKNDDQREDKEEEFVDRQLKKAREHIEATFNEAEPAEEESAEEPAPEQPAEEE